MKNVSSLGEEGLKYISKSFDGLNGISFESNKIF